MKRPILNLAVFVVVLTLAISSLAVMPVASDDIEEILLLLEELRSGVEDEHPSLENKVNAVFNQVEAGAYNGAINKLENDVTKSIIAWVEDPEELLKLVDKIIDLLEKLVEKIPDFDISAKPDELEIMQNSSDTSTITVKSRYGFNQRIDLSAELTPATDKVTLTLDPTWVIPTPEGNTSTLTVAVDMEAEEGEYVITVSGTNGTHVRSDNITLEVEAGPTPPLKGFTIEASPDSLAIQQGGSNTSIITVTSLKGFSRPVDLSITSMPIEGVSTTLSPSTVIPPPNGYAFSILTMDVASTTVLGNYTITVTGTSNHRINRTDITLQVILAPAKNFTVEASPDSLVVPQGGSDTSVITVTSLDGFSKTVDLTIESEPILGVDATLNPSEVVPLPNKSAISILTIDVASSATPGSYTVTVKGKSGSLCHSVDIKLKVTVPSVPVPPTPDFSIDASPTSLTIEQGASDKSIIIITSLKGFKETVVLEVTSESIEGVELTLNPSEVTPPGDDFATSTLTIEVELDASPGEYSISIEGTSCALTHSVTILLKVVVETTPPVIVSVMKQPEKPSYNETAKVLASVTDAGSGVKDVVLSYSRGTTWENKTMTLKEGLYKATVPAFPFNTKVNYRIYASDKAGNKATPSSVYSYDVADPYPPVIGEPSWSPEEPAANEEITVNVTVTEPTDGSGVKKVVLWYTNKTLEEEWQSIPMTFKEGNWTATIANQSDTVVTFFIEAFDKAGNKAKSEELEFTVAAPAGFPLSWILAAIAAVGAGSGGGVYYWRRRRKKASGTLISSTSASTEPPPAPVGPTPSLAKKPSRRRVSSGSSVQRPR